MLTQGKGIILELFLLFSGKYFKVQTSRQVALNEKLKASWTVSIWDKKKKVSVPVFPAWTVCLMNTEVHLKRFPWGMGEPSKKIVTLTRFKSTMKSNFTLKHGVVLIWKPKNCLVRAHSDRHWEMKEWCGWANSSVTVKVSLFVEPKGRGRGRWMSMRKGRINKMLSSAAQPLFYADCGNS